MYIIKLEKNYNDMFHMIDKQEGHWRSTLSRGLATLFATKEEAQKTIQEFAIKSLHPSATVEELITEEEYQEIWDSFNPS